MSKAAMPSRAVIFASIVACSALVVSALAAPVSFDVPLSGDAEVPAVATQGKGTAHIRWDASTRVVTWQLTEFRSVWAGNDGALPQRPAGQKRCGRDLAH